MSNNDWMIYSTCPSMSRLGFGINTDWLVCAKYHQILVWNLVQLIISWNVWMTLDSIRTMWDVVGRAGPDRSDAVHCDWLTDPRRLELICQPVGSQASVATDPAPAWIPPSLTFHLIYGLTHFYSSTSGKMGSKCSVTNKLRWNYPYIGPNSWEVEGRWFWGQQVNLSDYKQGCWIILIHIT